VPGMVRANRSPTTLQTQPSNTQPHWQTADPPILPTHFGDSLRTPGAIPPTGDWHRGQPILSTQPIDPGGILYVTFRIATIK
jgi:hypothetical protein